MLNGETNKLKIAQLLLFCLQLGTPKKANYTLEDLQKKLKFQFPNDYKKLRSCIDLLEDTEEALLSFFEFQLCANRDMDNFRERYIRLYGVLNAIYLQINAILEIAELVKYHDKENVRKKFQSLKIYEIRNIAGSHTVNFISTNPQTFKNPDNRPNFFYVTQCELNINGTNLTLVDGYGNFEDINLYNCIEDYCHISDYIVYDVVEKYIKTLFKIDTKRKLEFTEEINILRKNKTNYKKFNKVKSDTSQIIKEAEKLIKKISKNK